MCDVSHVLIVSGAEPIARRHGPIAKLAPVGRRRLDAAADRPDAKTSRLGRRLEVRETAEFSVVRTFEPGSWTGSGSRPSLYDLLDTADHGETTDVSTQIEATTAVETAGARPLPGARAGRGRRGCSTMR